MAKLEDEEETDSKIDKQFGRYRIMSKLATGGMAQIYKAKTSNNRYFCLKKILQEYSKQSDFIRMFLEEAKLSLSLNHPNIVRTLDLGQLEGSYYLAMEYVFGRDLGSLLRTSVEKGIYIPVDVACYMMLQCCRGMDYAHSRTDTFGRPLGLVHRDISPPNILVSYNGEPKILDFGIAKAVSLAPKSKTRSGVLKGKFCYMSPEQALGEPLDLQSDLFSLGIVLYELLTSKSLFYTPDEIETLEKVRKAEVSPPSRARKGLPKELDRIVLKALEAKKKNRFQNCGDFGRALRRFLQTHYPRTDSRTVAKFVRSLFAEDFRGRYQEATREGWRDILIEGGMDNELLLDRTANDLEQNSVRVKSFANTDDIGWMNRVLYDPKTSRRFWKYALWTGFFVLTLGVATGLYFSGYGEKLMSLTKKKPSVKNQEPAENAIISESENEEPFPSTNRGDFSFWVEKSKKAQAKGDLEAALSALRHALEINPFETTLLVERNLIRIAQGEYRESCRWFEEQTELKLPARNIAEAACLELAGETQKALLAYSSFVERYPDHPKAEKARAVIAALQKQLKY